MNLTTFVQETKYLTYRQAHYWAKQGFVKVDVKGSGYPAEVSEEEGRVLAIMARLVAASLEVKMAALLAREFIEKGNEAVLLLPGDIAIGLIERISDEDEHERSS